MKELQLVTYEQAKKLKLLGFDWKVFDAYLDDSEGILKQGTTYKLYTSKGPDFLNWNLHEDDYSAPSASLAIKWLRDVKDINISICKEYFLNNELENWRYYTGLIDPKVAFKSYEEAEIASLDNVLNELIKEQ